MLLLSHSMMLHLILLLNISAGKYIQHGEAKCIHAGGCEFSRKIVTFKVVEKYKVDSILPHHLPRYSTNGIKSSSIKYSM